MKSMEDLEKEQADARAALQEELTLAHAAKNDLGQMPLHTLTQAAWPSVVFQMTGLEEAINLFKRSVVVPFYQARDGFTALGPLRMLEAVYPPPNYDLQIDDSQAYAAQIVSESGIEWGPYAQLKWWTLLGQELVEVQARFGAGHLGRCWTLGPRVHAEFSRRGNLDLRKCSHNEILQSVADATIRWGGSGATPIQSSYRGSFLFKAEARLPIRGTDCRHVLDKLGQVLQRARC